MRTLLFSLLVLAAPRAALACSVCFGQSDSPMTLGTNMAVFFMLGVTGSVLAGFAGFFVYLMRRAALAAGGTVHAKTQVGGGMQEPEPHEGIA